jgi:hypothetical protein
MKRINVKILKSFRRDLIGNFFLGMIKKDPEVKGLNCSQFLSLRKRICLGQVFQLRE